MTEKKITTPSHTGHRGRLRRKFLDSGLGALHDYEALELLLTFAIPRRDVKPLAKKLIERFGSFEAVFDATEYELTHVKGVGENVAGLILLNKAICAKYLERKTFAGKEIRSAEETVDFVRMTLGGNSKETLMVLFFNSQRHLVAYHCVPGTVDRTAVFRREIVEKCFIHKATSIILAHNHPSGICMPSNEDIALTKRIQEAVQANDIEFVDHLIVTASTYRSLKADRFI